MRDIVERLETQAFVADKTQSGMAPLFEECLKEITRIRAENEKLRLELDMQTATILVPSQKDDQRRIERLNSALKEALDEAARLRRALHDIYEVYAGSEGDLKQAEGYYLLCLITEMSGIAAEHKS